MRLTPLFMTMTVSLMVSSPALAQERATDGGDERVIDLDDEQPEESEPDEVTTALTTGEELAAQAEDAFVAGDYQRAIDLLQGAYDAEQNPNMLYNIARVHEETGDLERALDFYQRFAIAPNVDLEYRREALQSSELIERKLADAQAAERASAEPQPPTTAARRDPVAGALYRPAPFPTTSPMRPLGFTLATIGGATVLAGGAVGLAALRQQAEFRDARTLAARRAAGSNARDLATAADAMYISGTVLIITGLVTAFASPRRERQQFDVTIRNDGVGAAWTVSF